MITERMLSRSIRYAVESGCYDSIDLGSSLTSWRSMNLTEMVLDPSVSILVIASYICDVG